jgi:DNA-directed DNA polymerase III PolC
MDAIIRISDLFKRVAELGQPGIAITDHGVLAGIHEGYKEYKKYKDQGQHIKFIPGSEIYYCEDLNDPKSKRRHLVVLAQNEEGYRNLLQINAAGFNNSVTVMGRQFPRVDLNILKKHSAGLFVNSACGGSPFASAIFEKNIKRAKDLASTFRDIFGDKFYIELQPHELQRGDFNQAFLNEQLKFLADELKINMIATCDSHYLTSKHEKYHDMVLAIGAKKALEDPKRHRYATYQACLICAGTGEYPSDSKKECYQCGGSKYSSIKPCPEFYLKESSQLNKYFAQKFDSGTADALIANTVKIANECEYPDYMAPKGHRLPAFPWKDEPDAKEFESWVTDKPSLSSLPKDASYLRFRIKKAFDKYTADFSKEKKQEYWERVKKELDILEMRNFSSYMLIVADYIQWAKNNGVTVGPGRGCLTGDTKVLTANRGFTDLADIKIGDKVFSHTGEIRNVSDTMRYDVADEELLSIKTEHSCGNIVLTKDHRVYGSKSDPAHRKLIKWIAAENLSVGDYIFMPYPKRESIAVSDIILHERDSNGNSIQRQIEIDSKFAYFIGQWVGAGYYLVDDNRQRIGIRLDIRNIEEASKVHTYLKSMGFNSRLSEDSVTHSHVIVDSQPLSRMLSDLFPKYNNTDDSRYIGQFTNLPDNLLTELILGLASAIESTEINNQIDIISVNTRSKTLALELKECSLYLMVPTSILVNSIDDTYKIDFRLLYDDTIDNTGYLCKILDITTSKADYVYDITVDEDHSYVTSNYAVHNSVGGSLVAYLLNIHMADSIKYGLLFERFQNREKKSLPDIDCDFAPSGREKVIQYCRDKYGEDKVAFISNILRLTPKLVIKDVARSLVIGGDKSTAFKIANDVTASIPDLIIEGSKRIKVDTMAKAMQASEKLTKFIQEYPIVLEYANELIGVPRSFATHAAGIVISDTPLPECAPLRRDGDGIISVQYDKDQCEEIGLVKMDILGLDTLDVLDETREIANSLGINLPDLGDLEDGDPKAYKLIHLGHTTGMFQLNNSMTPLCKAMLPKTISDIAAISAIGRPSVSKQDRIEFINRRFGRSPITYVNKCLEPVFKHTYGIPVYEEDLLKLAKIVAGWDLSEADGLRKLTKLKEKGAHLAAELEKKFIVDAMRTSDLSEKEATEIWTSVVAPFASYAFNLSHAIMYSMISYQTAYYKAHAVGPFICANLNNQTKGNKKDRAEIIDALKKDAKLFKINIQACDINISKEYYTMKDKNTIVTGLGAVKGVGKGGALRAIIAGQPYASFQDFLHRTPGNLVNKSVIASLALAGAFDSLGISRKYIFENFLEIRKELQAYAKKHGEVVTVEIEEEVEVPDVADDNNLTATDSASDDSYDGDFEERSVKTKVVIEKKIKRSFRLTPELLAAFVPSTHEKANIEFTIREKLEGEKSTLGEYLSGDISTLYPGFFIEGRYAQSYTSLQTMVNNINFPTEGIITSISEIQIKKEGKNKGRFMGKLTVENLRGESVEVTIWADQYEKLKKILRVGLPIRGMFKVNDYAGTKTLVLINLESYYKSSGEQ